MTSRFRKSVTSESRERPRLRVPGFGSAGLQAAHLHPSHGTEPNRTSGRDQTQNRKQPAANRSARPRRAAGVGRGTRQTHDAVPFGSVRRRRCCFNRKQDEPERGCLFPHPSFSDRLLCFLVTGPEETNDEPRETEGACPRAEMFRSRVRSAANLTLKSNVGTLQLLRDVMAPSEI